MDIAALFSNFRALTDPTGVRRPQPLDYDWRVDGETTILLSRDVPSLGADVGVVRAFLKKQAAPDTISRIIALLDQATTNAGLRAALIDSRSRLGRAAADGRLSTRMACVVDPQDGHGFDASTQCLLGFGIAPDDAGRIASATSWPSRGALIYACALPHPGNAPKGFAVRPLGVDIGDGPLYGAWWGIAP